MDDHIPDGDGGDLLHPPADPLVAAKAKLHQLSAWWQIMERVNDHYDPDGALFPTSHQRTVPATRRATGRRPNAAPPSLTAPRTWPTIPTASRRSFRPDRSARTTTSSPGAGSPHSTTPASDWTFPPLTAAALALDAAFAHPLVDPDEFADMLLTMADDLHNHGRLGNVTELDIVRPDDPDAN